MPPEYRRDQLMGGEGRSRGKDFELDLFGLPNVVDPKYRKKLMEAQDKKSGYVPFATAIELVKEIQPTAQKSRPFAFNLTHEVAKVL